MCVFYHNKEVITFFNVALSGGWIEESNSEQIFEEDSGFCFGHV